MGGDVEDSVAGEAGAVADGLGEMALADAGWTDEQNVGVGVDEAAGG